MAKVAVLTKEMEDAQAEMKRVFGSQDDLYESVRVGFKRFEVSYSDFHIY